MSERGYKFCPVCGSHNIQWELPHTWSTWRCRSCGYVGELIIEDGEMAKAIHQDYLEQKKKEEASDKEE